MKQYNEEAVQELIQLIQAYRQLLLDVYQNRGERDENFEQVMLEGDEELKRIVARLQIQPDPDQMELDRLKASLRSAGDYRDWDSVVGIEEQIEEIEERIAAKKLIEQAHAKIQSTFTEERLRNAVLGALAREKINWKR